MIGRHRLWVLALFTACSGKTVYPDGSSIEGQLEREVIALNQRVRMLEADLAVCGTEGEPSGIYGELVQIFATTEVTISRLQVTTLVTMGVEHLFSSPYDLRVREEATMTLDLLATALNLHPELSVEIEGHTDDRPAPGSGGQQFADDLELSWAYVRAVSDTLTGRFQVDPARITLTARGQHAPAASNDTAEGQRQNRRVIVYIHPAGAR